MPNFVGNDIGLGEIASSLKSNSEVIEERCVQIAFVIPWAVERPGCRTCETACRVDTISKDNQDRCFVWSRATGEPLGPNRFHVVDEE
mgnify:CR=1 FL=1